MWSAKKHFRASPPPLSLSQFYDHCHLRKEEKSQWTGFHLDFTFSDLWIIVGTWWGKVWLVQIAPSTWERLVSLSGAEDWLTYIRQINTRPTNEWFFILFKYIYCHINNTFANHTHINLLNTPISASFHPYCQYHSHPDHNRRFVRRGLHYHLPVVFDYFHLSCVR